MNYLLQTVISERYNFIAVTDVFQGLNELKRRQEIELIIIDVDYHTPDSWNFIQHIKTSGLYQDKQIVVLKSSGNRTAIENSEGAEDYFIDKPFNPSELIKKIDTLILTSSFQN